MCKINSLYSQSSCCLHALVYKYCLLHYQICIIPLVNRQGVQINNSSLKALHIVKSLFTLEMCHFLISLIFVSYQVPVPMSVKGRIILEILEGMAYLMGNQVIHKDLKPENILVDKNFHIKVWTLSLYSPCNTLLKNAKYWHYWK